MDSVRDHYIIGSEKYQDQNDKYYIFFHLWTLFFIDTLNCIHMYTYIHIPISMYRHTQTYDMQGKWRLQDGRRAS